MTEDVTSRIKQYVALRDRIKQMDDAFEIERNKFVTLKNDIEGRLRAFLEANNVDSLKTEAGTCYLSTKVTASLADANAFMKFVIDNQEFELLDRRANAAAVKEYVQQHGGLPPGVNLSTLQTLGVRRPSGK